MQETKQFTVSASDCLSRRQRLVIGFLFLVMMVAGQHDLTFSTHYDEIMSMSSDQLAYRIETGSIARQIAFVVLLIGGVLVLAGARNHGPYSGALSNNVPLACFIAFAFLSILWSGDPRLTFTRSTEYLIFCIGAAAAGRILGLRGVVWLGFLGSTGYLLIGFISELVLGAFQPLSVAYRFCGTLHPNHQAWNCVLLLISGSVLYPQIRGLWRTAYFVAMTLGVVCLILTKSRTSLVCGALSLIFYWAGRLSIKHKLAVVLSGAILMSCLLAPALLFSSAVTSQLNQILLAGRDADTYENFSGRVPLWQVCMEYVEKRPGAGYGFDSFWSPEHISDISAEEGWTVPIAHNGYIELMLSLGVIGLTLYLYQLAAAWRLLRFSYKATGDPFVRFYLALLIYYCACMLAEAIGFDVGLPTFCLLSMLWSGKLWFRGQSKPSPANTEIREFDPVLACK